jgi:hypothetical protein
MNLHMYMHIYICKEYDVDPAIDTYEKGRIYAYMHICIYVCICMYIYEFTYVYTYIHM